MALCQGTGTDSWCCTRVVFMCLILGLATMQGMMVCICLSCVCTLCYCMSLPSNLVWLLWHLFAHSLLSLSPHFVITLLFIVTLQGNVWSTCLPSQLPECLRSICAHSYALMNYEAIASIMVKLAPRCCSRPSSVQPTNTHNHNLGYNAIVLFSHCDKLISYQCSNQTGFFCDM